MISYVLFRIEFTSNKNIKKIMRMISTQCNSNPRNPNNIWKVEPSRSPGFMQSRVQASHIDIEKKVVSHKLVISRLFDANILLRVAR